MDLTSFHPTRFGEWVVKLSYAKEYYSFLIIATNIHTKEFMVRMFHSELEVINFVSFLGEKHE